jgi:hypothetical protein
MKRKDYWTWERIHKLGRASTDGGVRMMCEKLAVKKVKNITLLDNDIRCLNRIEKKRERCR